MRKLKLCFYGPSGTGKSTMAKYLEDKYNFQLHKISEPIHHFQQYIYKYFNKEPDGQDGELLQFLANKIENSFPGSLANHFIEKVKGTNCELIINDDCRLNSYEYLKSEGFIFIKVFTYEETRISRRRKDFTELDKNDSTELGFENFEMSFEIDNNYSFEYSFNQIDKIINQILIKDINPKKVSIK